MKTERADEPHARWVRICHWMAAVSIVTLACTGFVILMAHPRLYWGEAGNALMPALLELPIGRNHRHGGWTDQSAILPGSPEVVSANRTFEIFNENSWGRSLHFLAAWLAAAAGGVYFVAGFASGHFRAHLWPRPGELSARHVADDLGRHLRLQVRRATGGPQYGLLQKCGYCTVVFVLLPLTVATGLAMSPAITAAVPVLGGLFGGYQSARTIHFATFTALVLFTVTHVAMVILSGFRRQIRGMTIGD